MTVLSNWTVNSSLISSSISATSISGTPVATGQIAISPELEKRYMRQLRHEYNLLLEAIEAVGGSRMLEDVKRLTADADFRKARLGKRRRK